MPQLIVRYNPKLINEEMLRRIDSELSPLVASVSSVDGGPKFTVNDIEFCPYAHQVCHRGPDFSIEIRTFGFTDRIEALNKQAHTFRMVVLGVLNVEYCLQIPSEGLIWIQPISQLGVHV